MEEPIFPFFSEGDDSEQVHCFDCGRPLPEEGDPGIICVDGEREDGTVGKLPVCHHHWRERVKKPARPA
jgi:hypothetical protein